MNQAQSSDKLLVVRGVPKHTRMKVGLYAAVRDINNGQALTEIAQQGEPDPKYMTLAKAVGELATEAMKLIADEPLRDPQGSWVVRDVPRETCKAIKVNAILNDTTMANALEQLVDHFLQLDTDPRP